MPSNLHEWLLELFRNRSDSAADLLRNLNATLPAYDRVRIESPGVNNLKSVEYRADRVLFLSRGSRYVLGIIVEVQLRRDDRKGYAWPAYVAARFGPVPEAMQTRLRGASVAQLYAVGQRVLTAQTLEATLGALE